MPFPDGYYDPETLGLMTQAFNAAWEEVGFALVNEELNPIAVRKMMAARIMVAVRDGERDPERLKELAIKTVGEPQ